jgi:hypothetical protein
LFPLWERAALGGGVATSLATSLPGVGEAGRWRSRSECGRIWGGCVRGAPSSLSSLPIDSPGMFPSLSSPIPGPQFPSQACQFLFSLPPTHSFPRDLTEASRSEAPRRRLGTPRRRLWTPYSEVKGDDGALHSWSARTLKRCLGDAFKTMTWTQAGATSNFINKLQKPGLELNLKLWYHVKLHALANATKSLN